MTKDNISDIIWSDKLLISYQEGTHYYLIKAYKLLITDQFLYFNRDIDKASHFIKCLNDEIQLLNLNYDLYNPDKEFIDFVLVNAKLFIITCCLVDEIPFLFIKEDINKIDVISKTIKTKSIIDSFEKYYPNYLDPISKLFEF